MSSRGLSAAFLALLPAMTLVVGAFIAASTAGPGWQLSPGRLGSLGSAAVAPLVAAYALRRLLPRSDQPLVSTAGMLTAIGTDTLYLLSALPGADRTFYTELATRHGYFVGIGFLALVAGALANRAVSRVARYPFTLLALGLGCTGVTMVLGEAVNGARLWLRLGDLRFQPSEVARLLLAGFAAAYLYERRHLMSAPWRMGALDLPPAPYLLPFGVAIATASGVLVLQNDLGMAALIVFGIFSLLLAVQPSRMTVGGGLVVLALGIIGAFLGAPRFRDRVAVWLDPWSDPSGRGFQLVQADYALAAGGLTGRVPATAPAVPEVHTDFIMIAVGAEWGWLVAIALLGLTALLICRCVLSALCACDRFRALLALSLAGLFGIQLVLIGGGALRVLPLTGLTFPLVSYGGTSMVMSLFALGIIIGSRDRPTRIV